MSSFVARSGLFALLFLLACADAAPTDAPFDKATSAATQEPVVGPLLRTRWGQSGIYQSATPLKDGARTYPGCTTIATAQVLAYYAYQNRATTDVCYALEHAPLTGPDVVDGDTLCVALSEARVDWNSLAPDLTRATSAQIAATSRFIYQVGASLHAQYGGGEGTSATGKQIENAFRLQWGYSAVPRRQMSVISKDAFGYDDDAWAALIRAELDAGRPVLYMALQADDDAGHAFVIDGYAKSGLVHVNWGWGGRHDGWFDPTTLEDPSGRRWNRQAMIFRGLEPTVGYAAAMAPEPSDGVRHAWQGNGSLIALASGTRTGYGLTRDEAALGADAHAATFFQWEIDGRDGRRIEIGSDSATHATITYGDWSSRAEDRVFHDVTLPFVLDPSADGKPTGDGEFYVIAVTVEGASPGVVSARATTAAASSATSLPALPIRVGDHVWNGNGSLIAKSSGTATGYGLTVDEARVHPGADAPVVFFQWEIDGTDGRRVRFEGPGGATLRYGVWNDRSADVTRRVSFPFVLDPAADGQPSADGEYLVVSLAFDVAPSTPSAVVATIVN